MTRESKYDPVHEAQEHFRLILSAMANPGEVPVLQSGITRLEGLNKGSAIVGLALLNRDSSFFSGYSPGVTQEYFKLNTSSLPTSSDQADFLFLPGDASATGFIQSAKTGKPEYPETGAFLVIDAAMVSSDPVSNSLELLLKGPGVRDSRKAYVRGIDPALLDQILAKNEEYPLGVDTIITDPDARILCIPRTNQFRYKKFQS